MGVGLNLAELYVGPPGSGKSHRMAQRVRELGRTLPAYVIAHDLTETFTGRDVARYTDGDKLLRALATRPWGIHALVHEDGGAALTCALAACEAAKGRTPVVLCLDEASQCEGMSPHRLSPAFRRAWSLRRHLGLALCIGTQYPAQVHPQLWMSATRLVLFRIDSERARAALQRDAGLTPELAARVARLELARGTAPRVEGRHVVTINR